MKFFLTLCALFVLINISAQSDAQFEIELTQAANIRDNASTSNSKILFQGNPKDRFKFKGTSGNWYKIIANGREAYVHSSISVKVKVQPKRNADRKYLGFLLLLLLSIFIVFIAFKSSKRRKTNSSIKEDVHVKNDWLASQSTHSAKRTIHNIIELPPANDEFVKLVEELYQEKNQILQNILNDQKIVEEFTNIKSTSGKEAIKGLMTVDIVTSIKKVGKVDYDNFSPESLGVAYVFDFKGSNIYLDALKGHGIDSSYARDIRIMKDAFSDSFTLLESLLLHGYSKSRQYIAFINRCAQVFCRVDGKISKVESLALQNLHSETMELTKKYGFEVPLTELSNLSTNPIDAENTKESLEDVMNQLNSLIGLSSVKEEVQSLINFIHIQNQRKLQGLKSNEISLHCVFTGSPGTGKTTVARLLSKIYKHLGLLTEGNLIETDRSGLVAKYVGQSESKTLDKIHQALGGTLFIDEAYSLVQQTASDYGDQVIAVLLKQMEDNRRNLSIIVAGYQEEMNEFINSNPGLKSRFNRFINFPDFSVDELLQIFIKMASSCQYKLSEDAKERALSVIKMIKYKKVKNFGNAREMRNLFENTIENHSSRISKLQKLNKDNLTIIYPEDIRGF